MASSRVPSPPVRVLKYNVMPVQGQVGSKTEWNGIVGDEMPTLPDSKRSDGQPMPLLMRANVTTTETVTALSTVGTVYEGCCGLPNVEQGVCLMFARKRKHVLTHSKRSTNGHYIKCHQCDVLIFHPAFCAACNWKISKGNHVPVMLVTLLTG